jgi:Pyruvate/2-oxoacid:ferredoxin oxidoreductase delta subunit
VITGKNTTSGHFGFSPKVTDSTGQAATGATSIQDFPALAASQPCATLCTVGIACTRCGRFGGLSGGAGPYHYKVVSGSVPPGMTRSGLVLNGPFPAPFAGPPVDVIGPPPRLTWSLAVQVSDDFGATRTVTANWLVFGPIQMLCTIDVQCATCGDPCTDNTIQYVLGSPSDSVTVQVVRVCDGNLVCVDGSSALPPTWAATASGGTVSISINCGASCPNGFHGDVFIVLIDHGTGVAPAYAQSNEAKVNIDF